MAKKNSKHIELTVTKKELEAISSAGDIFSSMIGGGDDETEYIRIVRAIDRLLKRNGHKRNFS